VRRPLQVIDPAQETVVSFGTICAPALALLLLGAGERNRERVDDVAGDFVLHREHIVQAAVVAVRPQVMAAAGVDKLSRDPHPIANLADASLQHVTHAEFAADLPHSDRLALVGKS
jgi:hypothetical protein